MRQMIHELKVPGMCLAVVLIVYTTAQRAGNDQANIDRIDPELYKRAALASEEKSPSLSNDSLVELKIDE